MVWARRALKCVYRRSVSSQLGGWLLGAALVASCAHRVSGVAEALVERPSPPRPPQALEVAHTDSPLPPTVESLMRRLSLEEKVGQLMMVGFSGQTVDPAIEALLKGYRVGGVCLFGRNVASAEQITRLNDDLRTLMADADAIPPFITVDQEGGNVVRISDGNLVLPGNMALGATRDTALAYQAGLAQGEDLRRLGFNMNLAPVLDVNTNPKNPVIGLRSFGDDVALVSQMGVQFVKGQQAAEIATVAKHFPGHGGVDADSHKGLPVVQTPASELRRQLQPFAAAIDEGLDGMMTAHIATPTISDGDETPATLSPRVLGDLLRREMKFDGLVLTDELEMEAIARRYGVGRAAVLALNAGADMVLIPWRAEKKTEVWQTLLAAVKSGELPMARLDEAVGRVLTLKLKRRVFEPLAPRAERLAALGGKRRISTQIANAAVTLLKTDKQLYPLRRRMRVAVITSEPALARAVVRRVGHATALIVPAYPTSQAMPEIKQQVIALAREADVVVMSVVNRRQVDLFNVAALANRPMIAVVLGTPYLAVTLSRAQVVLSTYSYRESACEAATAALFGEADTPGRLPVALPQLPFGFGLNPGVRKARQAALGAAP